MGIESYVISEQISVWRQEEGVHAQRQHGERRGNIRDGK